MDLKLEGQKALVCGASRGLGFACAQALLTEGADCCIASSSEEHIREAADRLAEVTGRLPTWAVADLTQAGDREALFRKAEQSLGQIDILLANAGGPPPGPFESHPAEHWQLAIDLALGMVTHLCGLVLPGMRKRQHGRIVQIVSIAGLEAIDGLILSNASRPAVLGFAHALAREVGNDGVLVNSICPGIFLTDRIRELGRERSKRQGISLEQYLDNLGGDIPLGRPGDPKEVGDLASFLASPRNSYMTGAALVIDGGKTRRLL
ncbi:MAG: SDR family oxidoreductase [Deltaproteobacteria bacterium]|nr:SDR family oxidoreductase [Deltaproteobacteria bacterium]